MNTRLVKLIGIMVVLLPICVSATGCLGPDTDRNTGEFFGWGCTPKEMGLPDEGRAEDLPKATAPAPAEGTSDGTVLQYEAEDRVLIWKAGNDGGIEGGGGTSPLVVHDQDYYVVEVATYHAGWGPDAPDPSGTISLKAEDGTLYGPWETTVRNRSYWIATPNVKIPAGTYTLIDSDPSTWAQNSASGGSGMGWAYGVTPE